MTLITWTFFYLFTSISKPLPWTVCTENTTGLGCQLTPNNESCSTNIKSYVRNRYNESKSDKLVWLPSDYYFNKSFGSSAESFQSFSWQLILCLFCGWIIIFFSTKNGKLRQHKASIIPSLCIVLILVTILGTVSDDQGVRNGLSTYLEFEWKDLVNGMIWQDAATQVVLSLGLGTGIWKVIGKSSNLPVLLTVDILVVGIIYIVMSIFSGLVVFACLGHLASVIEVSNVHVLNNGLGVWFVTMSAGLTFLSWSVLWSFVLFSFVISLSLKIQNTMILTLAAAALEHLPYKQTQNHRSIYLFIICLVLFCGGILFTSLEGTLLLTIVDTYAIGWTNLVIGLLECWGLMLLYGGQRFCSDVTNTLNKRLSKFWLFTWSCLTPFSVLAILFYTIYNFKPSTVIRQKHLGSFIGWILFAIVLSPIPLFIIHQLFRIFKDSKIKKSKGLRKVLKVQPFARNTELPETDETFHRLVVITVNKKCTRGIPTLPYGYTIVISADQNTTVLKNRTFIQKTISTIYDNSSAWTSTQCPQFYKLCQRRNVSAPKLTYYTVNEQNAPVTHNNCNNANDSNNTSQTIPNNCFSPQRATQKKAIMVNSPINSRRISPLLTKPLATRRTILQTPFNQTFSTQKTDENAHLKSYSYVLHVDGQNPDEQSTIEVNRLQTAWMQRPTNPVIKPELTNYRVGKFLITKVPEYQTCSAVTTKRNENVPGTSIGTDV
ncbi:sodium-dependent noradrenaline transporter-like isoform X2 [Tachypleus tridentatus]